MLPGDWRVQFVCNLCFPLACQAKRSLFGSFGRIPLSKIICRQNVCFCEHQLDEVARLRAALPIAAVSCEVQIWGHGRRGGGYGPAIFWWCLYLDAYETFQFGKILSPGKARKRRWDCSELHGLCCNHVGIYIVSKKLLTWWREIRPCITLYISDHKCLWNSSSASRILRFAGPAVSSKPMVKSVAAEELVKDIVVEKAGFDQKK